MKEVIFDYIKETMYRNVVSIIDYEERDFNISVTYKFSWISLEGDITYHISKCTVGKLNLGEFSSKKR